MRVPVVEARAGAARVGARAAAARVAVGTVVVERVVERVEALAARAADLEAAGAVEATAAPIGRGRPACRCCSSRTCERKTRVVSGTTIA